MRRVKKLTGVLSILSLFMLSFIADQEKPVLYIIGDSTVKNGSGKGIDALWGWGSLVDSYFDTSRISIQNHAIGGRSSRTFITEGRWDAILRTLKKGDYVIMQFGHNDSGPLDDTARARGTIKGIGNEQADIYNPISKKNEIVYTYGHYLRQYIAEAKERGAKPIVCSPVPRNNFDGGKVRRGHQDYSLWAQQVAESTGSSFINLNTLIADTYDSLGAEAVAAFFPKDHTHPDKKGSGLNAQKVIQGLRALSDCDLKQFLK